MRRQTLKKIQNHPNFSSLAPTDGKNLVARRSGRKAGRMAGTILAENAQCFAPNYFFQKNISQSLSNL